MYMFFLLPQTHHDDSESIKGYWSTRAQGVGGENTEDKRFPESSGREKADGGAVIDLAQRKELFPQIPGGQRMEEKPL